MIEWGNVKRKAQAIQIKIAINYHFPCFISFLLAKTVKTKHVNQKLYPSIRCLFLTFLRIFAHSLIKNKKTMQEGTVKFFNGTKGFGFITPANGGQDIFVHVSGLYDEIRENDKVTFEVENGKKGLNAVNVKVI
jgi:CspA family cold shock protein